MYMTTKRKYWIDNLRGLCMLAILVDHTETYYSGNCIIDYSLYVVNALVVFFFISGYLMFRKTTNGEIVEFSLRHKANSILRTLVVPYFIFTSIIYIPKVLVHDVTFSTVNMITDILYGQASWFIAALCVAELIFSVVIHVSKGKELWLLATGVTGFIASIFLAQEGKAYIWQLDNAMQALLFLCAGYLYHKHEHQLYMLNKPIVNLILLAALVAIKLYEQANDIQLIVWHINIDNYVVFLLDLSVCTLLMVQIFKHLPMIRLLSWTGKHSLVYYFLCGGVPLLVSKIFNKAGMMYNGNYLYVVLAFILVYLCATAITYIVYRYMPFLVGRNNKL